MKTDKNAQTLEKQIKSIEEVSTAMKEILKRMASDSNEGEESLVGWRLVNAVLDRYPGIRFESIIQAIECLQSLDMICLADSPQALVTLGRFKTVTK